MKRVFALLLACVMMFALCGYANAAEAYDYDKRTSTPDFRPEKFTEAYERNKVNAKDEYIGNVYDLRAIIYDIEDDYVLVYPIPYAESMYGPYIGVDGPEILLKVPMEKEQIKRLAVDQALDIIGEIASIEEITNNEGETVIFISFNENIMVTDACYFIYKKDEIIDAWNKGNGSPLQLPYYGYFGSYTVEYYNCWDKGNIEKILDAANTSTKSDYVKIYATVFYNLTVATGTGLLYVYLDIVDIKDIQY